MREKIEYALALGIIKLSKLIPEKTLLYILKKLSTLLFYALKSRRNLAIHNIQQAYPNLSYNEAYELAKSNFKSIATTLCETLLVYNDKKSLDDMFINAKEAIDEVKRVSDNGLRPILFVAAHFGNWETLAHYFGYKGFPIVVIGREGNNKLIEKNITTPSRTKFGNTLANKDNAMFKMIKFLKEGKHAGILIDQKSSVTHSVITTFFKRECRTSTSVAILKLKFNPVIVPIFSLRQDDGRYKIIIKKFDDSIISGDKERDTFNITQSINNIFEEVVRLDPTQWFWMHNRWKMD